MTPSWVPPRLAGLAGAAGRNPAWPTEVTGADPGDARSVARLADGSALRDFPPSVRDDLTDLVICWLESHPRRVKLEWSALREAAETSPARAARAWNEALSFIYGAE